DSDLTSGAILQSTLRQLFQMRYGNAAPPTNFTIAGLYVYYVYVGANGRPAEGEQAFQYFAGPPAYYTGIRVELFPQRDAAKAYGRKFTGYEQLVHDFC
ncbi:MAG TPA: hypothetical protein VK669_10940, partial [Candidatus Limnocylindrales bacterium]|nr:hypothetical protein [Candidatus Limnocylindrales bacterium]